MVFEWLTVKETIRTELLSRRLEEPRLRLAALDSIEDLLGQVCPGFQAQTEILLSYGEADMLERLGRLKATGRLNGAERSVLHNVYQVLNGELSPTPAV